MGTVCTPLDLSRADVYLSRSDITLDMLETCIQVADQDAGAPPVFGRASTELLLPLRPRRDADDDEALLLYTLQ